MLQSINPATNELIGEYDEHSFEEVEVMIENAHLAQEKWKETEFGRRSELLRKLSESLEKNKEQLAKLMAFEMGKPLAQGRSEVEKCAWLCAFYSEKQRIF